MKLVCSNCNHRSQSIWHYVLRLAAPLGGSIAVFVATEVFGKKIMREPGVRMTVASAGSFAAGSAINEICKHFTCCPCGKALEWYTSATPAPTPSLR